MAAKKIRKPKKTAPEKGPLDFCRAIVDGYDLTWEYRFSNLPEANLKYEDTADDLTDSEIIDLTMQTLGIDETARSKIEVIHE